MTATSYTDAAAHKVVIQNGRKEPPVFLEVDPIGQAIRDVDAAITKLGEMAIDYRIRKRLYADRKHLQASRLAFDLVCSLVESV